MSKIQVDGGDISPSRNNISSKDSFSTPKSSKSQRSFYKKQRICGFLEKKGNGLRGKWQTRWFELNENSLTYFSAENGERGSCKGIFKINRFSGSFADKDGTINESIKWNIFSPPTSKFIHSFKIINAIRDKESTVADLELRAESEFERREWIDALKTTTYRSAYDHLDKRYNLSSLLSSSININICSTLDIIYDLTGNAGLSLDQPSRSLDTLDNVYKDLYVIPGIQEEIGFSLKSLKQIGNTVPSLDIVSERYRKKARDDKNMYTFIMLNPDFELKEGEKVTFLHWLVVNARLDPSERPNKNFGTILEYLPPCPSHNSGLNRILVLVCKQKLLVPQDLMATLKGKLSRLTNLSIRELYKLFKISSIVAVNCFMVQWEQHVDLIHTMIAKAPPVISTSTMPTDTLMSFNQKAGIQSNSNLPRYPPMDLNNSQNSIDREWLQNSSSPSSRYRNESQKPSKSNEVSANFYHDDKEVTVEEANQLSRSALSRENSTFSNAIHNVTVSTMTNAASREPRSQQLEMEQIKLNSGSTDHFDFSTVYLTPLNHFFEDDLSVNNNSSKLLSSEIALPLDKSPDIPAPVAILDEINSSFERTHFTNIEEAKSSAEQGGTPSDTCTSQRLSIVSNLAVESSTAVPSNDAVANRPIFNEVSILNSKISMSQSYTNSSISQKSVGNISKLEIDIQNLEDQKATIEMEQKLLINELERLKDLDINVIDDRKHTLQLREENEALRCHLNEAIAKLKIQSELTATNYDLRMHKLEDQSPSFKIIPQASLISVQQQERDVSQMQLKFQEEKQIEIATLQKELLDVKAREKGRMVTLEGTLKLFTSNHEEAIARERSIAEGSINEYKKKCQDLESEISNLYVVVKQKEDQFSAELNKLRDSWRVKENVLREEFRRENLSQVQEIKKDFLGRLSDADKLIEQFKLSADNNLIRATAAEEMVQKQKNFDAEHEQVKVANAQLLKDLAREKLARKKLHNQIEDMKGRIRVYCRIRPLLDFEIERGGTEAVLKYGPRTVFLKGSPGHDEKIFNFDQVFGGADGNSQEHIFRDTKNIIRSVVDGYNACIFAYGQTGAGKSYSMIGSSNIENCFLENGDCDKNAGIIPRAISELYRLLNESALLFSFEVSVQIFQLYRENLEDLLKSNSKRSSSAQLNVVLAEHSPTGLVEIEGATSAVAGSSRDVMRLLSNGLSRRAIVSTNMNTESSRSHFIFCLTVKLTNRDSGEMSSGKLTLCDLAGSERINRSGVTGEVLKETISNNKSLSALVDVISALTSKLSHIPYRNHILTKLMSDSLGGNAKTLMLINVSPASINSIETNNTLSFANRCKDVINTPVTALETSS